MTIRLYNLLFERATDDLVLKTIPEFFISTLETPVFKKEGGDHPGYPFYQIDIDPPLYEDYVKKTGDNGIVFKNEEHYMQTLSGVFGSIPMTIRIYPKSANPKLHGSVNDSGLIKLYYKNWVYDLKAPPPPDSIPSPEEILSELKKTSDPNKTLGGTAIHEIGHYITLLRTAYRNKDYKPISFGQMEKIRNRDPEIQYQESTNEMQSRMTEFVKFLNNIFIVELNEAYRLYNKPKLRYNFLIKALAEDNYETFYTFALFTPAFVNVPPVNELSPRAFKYLIGDRLWGVFNDYKDKGKILFDKLKDQYPDIK